MAGFTKKKPHQPIPKGHAPKPYPQPMPTPGHRPMPVPKPKKKKKPHQPIPKGHAPKPYPQPMPRPSGGMKHFGTTYCQSNKDCEPDGWCVVTGQGVAECAFPGSSVTAPSSTRGKRRPKRASKSRRRFGAGEACKSADECGPIEDCVDGVCTMPSITAPSSNYSGRAGRRRRRNAVPAGSRYDGHRTAAGYPITYQRRRFGALDTVIKAVKIAEADGKPSTPGSNILPLSAKVKPTPSVPSAPSNLPAGYDFCVQENGMFIRARDPNHKLHGKHVLGSCFFDEELGMRMCSFDVGGDVSATVPACVDPAEYRPAPVPQGCCVDLETSTLVCEGNEYHGLIVEIVAEDEIEGMKIASVEHPDLPGGGARMPICVPMDKPKRPPIERPPAERVPYDCCIDEDSLSIVCADPTHSQHGRSVKDIFVDCVDKIDGRHCRLKVGDHVVELPVCHVPPPPPPDIDEVPETPVLCCYDVESGTLVCPNTIFHGLKVDAVTMTELPDGTQIASVEHPSLPGGGLRAPMCSPIRVPVPEPSPVPREPEPYETIEPQDPYHTEHGHCEVVEADAQGYGVGYRGMSPLPGMRGAGQEGHRFAGFSGRPSELSTDRNWKNRGPLASARDGWKPPMTSLQQGGICLTPWGNVGMENPPNISGDSAGYNTRLWQNQPHDHLLALSELGYEGDEEEMVRGFQSDWNWVSQAIANNEGMKQLEWTRLLYGNLAADGEVGPNTLNALEAAIINQRNGLAWARLVEMSQHPEQTTGRRFARTTKARMRGKSARPRAPGCWVGGKYVVPCPDSAGSVSAAPGKVRKPGCWVNGKYVVPCPDTKASSKR